ncbi:helix-turn-helix transcriptional regulator [Streptomyces sp. NPDC004539]|uniref:helix-turn-helix transcriptional regulator n=1 Tax=Streptomyces sp. NPDC004539 TaxID=3154280 RepID=UPI0033B1C139
MSGSDPVAAFWRPLKAEVRKSGLSQKEVARELALSPSALSELLNGHRAKAPDWDVVRKLVRLVGGEVGYWRKRLEELEVELDRTERDSPGRSTGRLPVGCVVCDSGDHLGSRYDYGVYGMPVPDDLDGISRVLAGPDDRLIAEAESVNRTELRSDSELAALRHRFDGVVRRLLTGLRGKVRGACGSHRALLLHAAHRLLVVDACLNGPILGWSWPSFELNHVIDVTLSDSVLTSAPLSVEDVSYTCHHSWAFESYERVALALDINPRLATETATLYETRLVELAAECPELYLWTTLRDGPEAAGALHACPSDTAREELEGLYSELRAQTRGLDGLENLLRVFARDPEPAGWPACLATIHRNELRHSISSVGEGIAGPRIPRLAQGYVNPAFRIAVHGNDSRPHVDAWWNTRPLHQEIQGFLAGHLSGFPTPDRPLIVLGDPGAGKSLLTRLLAARLPPSDYLPIRIELRDLPADIGILDQIAHALRALTHREATWSTVTRSSPNVMPVLIFDGLDELLQAGGDHYHYLDDIADFQRRSADNGRPVAAIVTSRTVVADQASIPLGSVVIRLEPFDGPRIARWTRTWHRCNTGRPRLLDLAASYPELAPQPLLLLMLALYHSVEPDPGDTATMSRATLYERLLSLFVRRQIAKLEPRLRPDLLERRTEDELDLLSVIAVAMFNRGRQGVTGEEAEHDLAHLRAPDNHLTAPEPRLLFGRFFFIHEARARFDGGEERLWYEFLHATFGEYLVARKIARSLDHPALLFALLSSVPLTDRARIIDDLRDLAPSVKRVQELFPRALFAVDGDIGYATGPVTVTYRHACYSANLLLLALAPGTPLHFSEVAGEASPPGERWRALATLWKSQFSAGTWDAFTRAVRTTPVQSQGTPNSDIVIQLGDPYGAEPAVSRRVLALHDPDIEELVDPALPVWEAVGGLTGYMEEDTKGRLISRAHDLVALLLAPPAPHGDLPARYERCLRDMDEIPMLLDGVRYHGAIAHRLTAESERLPGPFVSDALWQLVTCEFEGETMADETRIALLACACRQRSRTGTDNSLDTVIATLLGVPPVRIHLPAAARTGPVLSAILTSLQEPPLNRPLTLLLKTAIRLDLHHWCTHHAVNILNTLDAPSWHLLSAADAEYLHPILESAAPALARRLATPGQGRHP